MQILRPVIRSSLVWFVQIINHRILTNLKIQGILHMIFLYFESPEEYILLFNWHVASNYEMHRILLSWFTQYSISEHDPSSARLSKCVYAMR